MCVQNPLSRRKWRYLFPPPFDDLLRYTTDGRSLTRSERGEIFFLTLSKQPCNSEEEEEEEREEAFTCVREIFGR